MLRGKLVHYAGTRGILDVSGVGYEVFSPTKQLAEWSGEEEVLAWVSTQVREDSIALYGFGSEADQQGFNVLLSVTGVGPKMALSALDSLSVDQIAAAVAADDTVTLSKINGVGKKKAQRLALELKGKLTPSFTPTGTGATARRTAKDDLPLALAQLDYGKSEIDRALAALSAQELGPDQPLPARLSAALRFLSGSKR